MIKKLKLIIAAVALLGLVPGSAAYADGFAPGEGMYLGVFGGHGAGHVAGKTIGYDHSKGATPQATTIDIDQGGLGLSGIEGGGWLGYGYKSGVLYLGFEIEADASDTEVKVTSSPGVEVYDTTGTQVVTEASIKIKWSAGVGARVGYYLSNDTLLAVKAGISASEAEVKFGSDSDDFYGGGVRVATSVESKLKAIDPNLNLRIEYAFTDFETASVFGLGGSNAGDKHDSEVSGQQYSGRLGLTYSFFEVGSFRP